VAQFVGSRTCCKRTACGFRYCGDYGGALCRHGAYIRLLLKQKAMKRLTKESFLLSRAGEPAAPLAPRKATIKDLRRQASSCKVCDLWKNATQTVFGEGDSKATIMLVGEQPGDQEDLVGKPFVGPAGKLLDEALAKAGIDRTQVYLTNVVKHFKWTLSERGKRRIHKKPRSSEIQACRPWLIAELTSVKPTVLVCLGATAAQSLLGNEFSVTRQHGKLVDSDLAPCAIATVHPHPSCEHPTPNHVGRRCANLSMI
jgi:uracil-DNA glycosylase